MLSRTGSVQVSWRSVYCCVWHSRRLSVSVSLARMPCLLGQVALFWFRAGCRLLVFAGLPVEAVLLSA